MFSAPSQGPVRAYEEAPPLNTGAGYNASSRPPSRVVKPAVKMHDVFCSSLVVQREHVGNIALSGHALDYKNHLAF